MTKRIDVYPTEKKWAVKGNYNERVSKYFSTQADAIEFGCNLARNQSGEFAIYGRNGRVREQNSYGNDPHPPTG